MGIMSSSSQLKPMQMKMMDKRNCRGLVREALKAMMESGDLTISEAEAVGMAATCRPWTSRAGRRRSAHFRCTSRTDASTGTRRTRLLTQLIKYYGEPAMWTNLEPLCGLLLSAGRLTPAGRAEERLASACGPCGRAARR